jgi:tripartite-type tricarboxylate transporter receptor subunit TctC
MPADMPALKRGLRLVLLAASLLAALCDAHAQGRPIRVIVSQAAGGTPDIVCRLLADRMSRATGQPIVVENRPGGGNVIGAQAAARAAPDGHSFFFATAAALVTNPHTFKTLPYDPARDFVPVSMVGKAPFLLLVHPGVRAHSLAELVALEKAQPGKLTFATDGPRNFSGMVAAWLNKLAGTSIPQAPYAAMPQGVQDTVAGRTQLVVIAIPSAAPLLKRRDLRALALTATQRAPGYEDIPTVAETFTGFDLVGWFAFVAPAGTPPEAVRRFNREMGRILDDPAVVARLREAGVYTDGALTPEATGEFIRAEYSRWGRIVREIGLQPE